MHAILRNFNDHPTLLSSVHRRHNNTGVRGADEVADDVQAEASQGEHSGASVVRRRGGLRGRFRRAGHHRGDLRHVCHWSVLFHFHVCFPSPLTRANCPRIEFNFFHSVFSVYFKFITSNFFLLFHSIFKIDIYFIFCLVSEVPRISYSNMNTRIKLN